MDTLLEMRNIQVSFGPVKVLENGNIELKKGEIHALMGENGAGKSSLMKTLIGLYPKKSGDIFLRGKSEDIKSPSDAISKGIVMIHQEIQLAPDLTVTENIFLGRESKKRFNTLNRKEMEEEVRNIFKQLKINLSPNELVGKIGIGQQQMVAIAKAISAGAEVIIMDESTTALSENEVEHLFKVLRELSDEGITFIMITHRLEEVFNLADRVTVMRDGTTVTTMETRNLTTEKLITLMVGRNVDDMFPKIPGIRGKKSIEVNNITLGNKLKNISFEAYQGEVLGIAGLMGAGRTELCDVLFGARKIDAGEIRINERLVNFESPHDAISNGIAYVTEDRKGNGLCLQLNIPENIIFPIVDRLSFMGVVNKKKVSKLTSYFIEKLEIKVKDMSLPVDVLSGGNQQKVILAKWLASEADIFLLDEPTRGIDVNTKVGVYNLINELVQNNKTVILISSYLPELMEMSDRFIVLSEGKKTAELSKEEATAEKIMYYATLETH